MQETPLLRLTLLFSIITISSVFAEEEAPLIVNFSPTSHHGLVIRIGNDFELNEQESADGIILISANAILHGKVKGNIFSFASRIELSDSSTIEGDVMAVMSNVVGEANLSTEHYRKISNIDFFTEIVQLLMAPHKLWNRDRTSRFQWNFVIFVTMIFIHFFIVNLDQEITRMMTGLISDRAFGYLLIALLMLLCIPFFATIAVVSLVGIPLLFLSMAIITAMAIYGRTAIFLALSGSLLQIREPKLALIFLGYSIYRMTLVVPYVRELVFLMVNLMGVGLVIRVIRSRKELQNRSEI